KVYRFTIRWGAQTSTDDAEGEVLETPEPRHTATQVAAALPPFTGAVMHRPPAFSAIKVGGDRAYDPAPAGQPVHLSERPVTIGSLVLLRHGADVSEFEMACEKGTYVRALTRDLAIALGTRGHVAALRRTAVGGFSEAEAVTMDALEAAAD